MTIDPELEAAIKLAETHYQQGQFVEAIEICRSAIASRADFAPAYHLMGNVFFAQGQLDRATQAYHQAIELNPNFASSYANLGNIFYQQGDLDRAIAHYNQALELHPNLAEVYWNLAKAFARQGRQQQAILCQEVALELKPILAGVETHQKLGNVLAEQGQLDGAIRSYQRALQINPHVAETHLNLGVLWKQQGNLAAAVQNYQQAIALNPSLFAAYFNLGNALEQQGEIKPAIAAYLQGLQIKPDLLSAYYKIAECLQKLGRHDEATICYDSRLPTNLLSEFLPSCPAIAICSLSDKSSGIEIKPIYPPTKTNLQPAITLDSPLHPDFTLSEYQFSPAFVVTLSSGRIWADSENIAVITSQNQLIPELSQGSPELIVTSEKLPPPVAIEGTVACLSVRDGHNYFHWMLDLLPRLHLLLASGINWNDIDKFIVNSHQYSFQRESLQLLGIPESKLIASAQFPHIQAQKLIVPSVHRMRDRITNWGGEFLRNQFMTSSVSSPHYRLYISRNSAQYRRVLNEPEVIDFLSDYGFRAVTMESFSVKEQVSLIANATVTIAPHGAGLTNLIFSPPGSTVIELFSPDYLCNLYWAIGNLNQLKYYYLVGDNPDQYYLASGQAKPEYIHPAGSDILVNLNQLRSLMELAGII